MAKVTEVRHPLIQHKLSILRNVETGTKDFSEIVEEIAMLLAYEVTRDYKLEDVEVQTPMVKTICKQLEGKKTAIVPILRAGLGMVEGVRKLIPAAKVGHIGMYRNEETLEPVEYFCKLPKDIEERDIILVDPMLATGGSAIDAVNLLKKRGAKNIKFVGLIAAPEGIEAFQKAHDDVEIYVASIDERLNENGYILPGLGDAGDRLFGTK